MKVFMTLGLLFGFAAVSLGEDKKETKFDAEKFMGKWMLTGGKKLGEAITDDAKKGEYVITKDKIKIMEGDKEMFVMEYKIVDAKASPVKIDMKIVEAPIEDVKGSKAQGILMLDGDTFKICYYPMTPDARPAKFDDDKANSFELKRAMKDEKK